MMVRTRKPFFLARLPILVAGLVLVSGCAIALRSNHIHVVSLPDGTTTQEGTMLLSGKVPDSTLKIQGMTITGSPDGSFTHSVVLQPGYNEIRVDATNQHGRTKSEMIRVVRTETPPRFVRGDSSITTQ